MNPSLKLILLCSTIIGLAAASAPSADARVYGANDWNHAIATSLQTGGYCDNAGCPDRFWKFPIHYGPVFFHGQWYRGPVYFRADRHGRQYWVNGGWHRDEWRGRRPMWAQQSHDGPALGIDYYANHGFRTADRGRQSYNADNGQGEAVSFQTFHRSLAAHGDWVYSDRWGEVWVPADVPNDFHPYYSGGHWANTREYGWLWVSDYEWGDIAFHYGRWVNDPDDGWMWIPGYVWSPGWVVWRSNDHYTGWMPMPPDEGFLNGNGDNSSFGVTINFNRTDDYYGYSRWYGRGYDENRFASNWVFIGTGDLSDRDYRSHAVSRDNVVNVISTTTNVTNYTVVNNYVVNRSVDVKVVERASGRPVPTVEATTVIKSPSLVTTADTGRAVQVRMRDTQPRGTGIANSAPQPSQDVVKSLSTRPVERNGHVPARLFTQTTVVNAPLKPAAATPSTPAVIPPGVNPNSAPVTKPHGTETNTPTPAGVALPGTPAGSAPNASDQKPGRDGKHLPSDRVNPVSTPTLAPIAPGADRHMTTPTGTTFPSVNSPAPTPSDTGAHNRDLRKGAKDIQFSPATQGGAMTPSSNAPTITAPPTNNRPSDMSGRNRDLRKGGKDNQVSPAPQGGAMTPSSNAPTITPPATNNPPSDMGGRNRDLRKGGKDNQVSPAPQGGAMTPSSNAPTITPPATINPPSDTGRRNRDLRKGGKDNLSSPVPQSGVVTPVRQKTPAAPAATPPADTANPPADKTEDHGKHKPAPDGQGADPNVAQ